MKNTNTNTNVSDHAKLAIETLNFIARKHGVSQSFVYAAYFYGNVKIVAQFNELMGIAWDKLRS